MNKPIFLILFSLILFSEKISAQQDTVLLMIDDKCDGILFKEIYDFKLRLIHKSRIKRLKGYFNNPNQFEYLQSTESKVRLQKFGYTLDSLEKLKNYFEENKKFIDTPLGIEYRLFYNDTATKERNQMDWNRMSLVHREVGIENIEFYKTYFNYENFVRRIGNSGGYLDIDNLGGFVLKEEDSTKYKVINLSDYVKNVPDETEYFYFDTNAFWITIKDSYKNLFLEFEESDANIVFKKVSVQFHGGYID